MLSCSIWFSAPSFWMGGGLESLCVGRVYGADGAVQDGADANCRFSHSNVNNISDNNNVSVNQHSSRTFRDLVIIY